YKHRVEALGVLSTPALINTLLDDMSAASSLAERATGMSSIHKDALIGPEPLDILSRVAAQAGQLERSIDTLEKLIALPYAGPLPENLPITPALLRFDPMFDPLRGKPRFERLATSDGRTK